MAVAETREASFNRKWKVETFNARKFAAQNFTLLIRTANSWPRGGRRVLDRALGQSGRIATLSTENCVAHGGLPLEVCRYESGKSSFG